MFLLIRICIIVVVLYVGSWPGWHWPRQILCSHTRTGPASHWLRDDHVRWHSPLIGWCEPWLCYQNHFTNRTKTSIKTCERNKKQFCWCFAEILLNLSVGVPGVPAEGEQSSSWLVCLETWWIGGAANTNHRGVHWVPWLHSLGTRPGYTSWGSWLGARLNNVLRPTRWVNQV